MWREALSAQMRNFHLNYECIFIHSCVHYRVFTGGQLIVAFLMIFSDILIFNFSLPPFSSIFLSLLPNWKPFFPHFSGEITGTLTSSVLFPHPLCRYYFTFLAFAITSGCVLTSEDLEQLPLSFQPEDGSSFQLLLLHVRYLCHVSGSLHSFNPCCCACLKKVVVLSFDPERAVLKVFTKL